MTVQQLRTIIFFLCLIAGMNVFSQEVKAPNKYPLQEDSVHKKVAYYDPFLIRKNFAKLVAEQKKYALDFQKETNNGKRKLIHTKHLDVLQQLEKEISAAIKKVLKEKKYTHAEGTSSPKSGTRPDITELIVKALN